MDDIIQFALDAIDNEASHLNALSDNIWKFKELAFQEKLSHEALCDFLKTRGFSVKSNCGTGNLATAFVARWEKEKQDSIDDSRTPHVAVICEYDALPEIGHACGHNLIAEIGVAAALGIKASMEKSSKTLGGKLSVIGTPGEEGGGGKVDVLDIGVFDDVDIALMAHPAPFSDTRPIFLSTKRFRVSYFGKESHACGFPWEGVNALDAAVQAYTSIGTLRQQLKPDWRVGVIITKGGTKVNIIPKEAEMMCQIRTATESDVELLEGKVMKCLTAAADATGCKVKIEPVSRPYKNLISNETLAQLYESSLITMGRKVETPKSKIILGSTDMGNVSYKVPSLHPTYNCNTTAFNHTIEFTQASGSPEAQDSTLTQGKALAMTALKVLWDPSLLDKIRHDFQEDLKNA